MNMVMAMILPVPGRKRRFVGPNCTAENHAYVNIFQSLEALNDVSNEGCSEFAACLEVLRLKEELELLDVLVDQMHLKLGDCQRMFPECAY